MHDDPKVNLENIVYECVRHYAQLWDETQRAKELVACVQRAKAACPGPPAEIEQLAEAYTELAWQRVAVERGDVPPPLRGSA